MTSNTEFWIIFFEVNSLCLQRIPLYYCNNYYPYVFLKIVKIIYIFLNNNLNLCLLHILKLLEMLTFS